ncbi:MAG: glycosyltransferase, partial [Alphaproteobacteria bacterium]|nr:glycosyltransferase [Alphaproteobacteria bacterium]
GGGAMGDALLRSAILARAESALAEKRWRVLVGVKAPDDEFEALTALAAQSGEEGGIVVERARGDFPSLLMNCAMSISQGGYNTMMECMHAGCRAVVVPYAGGLETEQTLRAELLAKRGVITVLEEADLSPPAISDAIARSLAGPGAASAGVRTDGAAEGARQVAGWAATLDW